MAEISIGAQMTPEGLPEAAVRVDVHIHVAEGAPPALLEAVGNVLGRLCLLWDGAEVAEQVVREVEEIRARTQRQADNAARILLGDHEVGEGMGDEEAGR